MVDMINELDGKVAIVTGSAVDETSVHSGIRLFILV